MTTYEAIHATFPRVKKDHELSSAENDLTFAALGTEKLRVMVLMAIITASALFSLVPPTYFAPGVAAAFHGDLTSFLLWRFALLGGLVVYLVAERWLVGYLIKRTRQLPKIYHYFTATIETSCPTIAIALTASYTDPGSFVSTIPAFAYPLFIVLSALRLNFRLSVYTGVVAAFGYYLVSEIYAVDGAGSFGPVHVAKAIALLVLGIVTGLVAMQIKKGILNAYKTAEERNEIVNMFGKHVSPAVVDELLAYGSELPSAKKNVCVMFLDIRNFTTFAEKKSPEEVVHYLEQMFGFMIDIVNEHNGIINKFLGDGFMAVFGAPISGGNDCLNAVTASSEILKRLRQEIELGTLPETRIGIGLHAGEAVTGNIGSSLRKEYTVIGDVVNLAARIEKLNKEFGSRLLVSEMVWESAFGGQLDYARPKGNVQVRGREERIKVYQVA